jgi:hypothetical protein
MLKSNSFWIQIKANTFPDKITNKSNEYIFNFAGQLLAMLALIRYVPSSILGTDADYCNYFLWFSSDSPGKYWSSTSKYVMRTLLTFFVIRNHRYCATYAVERALLKNEETRSRTVSDKQISGWHSCRVREI